MSNKSNLAVLSTTLAATGAVVVGAGTTAHADTVKAPAPEQVQTVKAQDQKLDDDINQAQSDVDNAQKNATKLKMRLTMLSKLLMIPKIRLMQLLIMLTKPKTI